MGYMGGMDEVGGARWAEWAGWAEWARWRGKVGYEPRPPLYFPVFPLERAL